MNLGTLIFVAEMQYKNLHLTSAMVFKFTSNSNKLPPLLGINESRELDLLLVLEMSDSIIYCYPVDDDIGHTIHTKDLPKLLGDISEYVELKFRIPDKPPSNENPIISSGGLWVIKGDIPEEKHYGVGSMHLEKGRIHEAIEEFKKSVGYNAKYVNSLYSLGVCYSELNDYEKALNWFEKASKYDPSNRETVFNRALMLKKLQKFGESLVLINKLLLNEDINPNVLILKGNILSTMGNDQDAVDTYNRALEIDPHNQLARRNCIDLQNRLKVKIKKGLDKQISTFEDSLYNYLEIQGAAFTIKALEKRLESFIEDINERKYGRENLEQILNKLRANGQINSVQHNGETHYFVPK